MAAAGGDRKPRVAADLGAGVTVDYTEPGWAERLREQVGGVDVAFDGVGGETGLAAFELVRAGGRFCPCPVIGQRFPAGARGGRARRHPVAGHVGEMLLVVDRRR